MEIQLAGKSPSDQLRRRSRSGDGHRDHPTSLLCSALQWRAPLTLMAGVAMAVSVTCFCRASLCWRQTFISSLTVWISSLCLSSTALILLWVSCSSACSFSVMFCKHKWRASYWDLPSAPAFFLKITSIQPPPSAFLHNSTSIVIPPSWCWSLELTRLSPRTYVLCPC